MELQFLGTTMKKTHKEKEIQPDSGITICYSLTRAPQPYMHVYLFICFYDFYIVFYNYIYVLWLTESSKCAHDEDCRRWV